MKSISLLATDVRMMVPGCPDFLITHALTRALAQFLDESEAWLEWGPTRNVSDIETAGVHSDRDGILTWSNHLDSLANNWVFVTRLKALKWVPTGQLVAFKTADQLQSWDSDWRNTTGAVPTFWTSEGEGSSGEIQIRVYPIMDTTVEGSYQFLPRFVLGTEVVAGIGLTAYDDQIPQIPDRIFNAFREGLVAGALSKLYMIPGRDWSEPKSAMLQSQAFAAHIATAKARAAREFGHTDSLVAYGGY